MISAWIKCLLPFGENLHACVFVVDVHFRNLLSLETD